MSTEFEKRLKTGVEKRIKAYLQPKSTDRNQVCEFIDLVASYGEAYLVGGLLRDLLFYGYRKFTADIDLVIDKIEISDFDNWMASLGAKKNRFGGYSLHIGSAKFDIWLLQKTWANVSGHYKVRCPIDLHYATFFDWDCILYSATTGEIMADEGYFDRIRRKVIDIRLAENPSPLGNAVRALRYACRYDAMLSPRLAEHVRSQILENGWGSMVNYERRAFGSLYLEVMDGIALTRRLTDYEPKKAAAFQVRLPPQQLSLIDEGLF